MADTVIPGLTGRFALRSLLGSGGQGEVYAARDTTLQREVALKRLHGSSNEIAAARDAFLHEARVQAGLEHPGVPPIHELLVDAAGTPVLAMRRVEGVTLARVLANLADGDADALDAWPLRRRLNAFLQVARTIHYAHSRHVVHGDLKPANIMLGTFGEVYVLDWGVARSEDPPAQDPGTGGAATEGTEVRVGTLGYAAPEMLSTGANPSPRSDVYALGVILWEIIALRPLHRGLSREQAYEATLEGQHAAPSKWSHGAPARLDQVCLRAMSREPAGRFADAGALADALERVLDGVRAREYADAESDEHLRRARDLLRARDSARNNESAPREIAAVRELLRAVALRPDSAEARGMLAQVLLSAEDASLDGRAETAFQGTVDAQRSRLLRAIAITFGSWLGIVPFTLWSGIRWWAPTIVGSAALLAGIVYAWILSRKPAVRTRQMLVIVLLGAAPLAAGCFWMGPFLLVPTAMAMAVMLQVFAARRFEGLFAVVVALLVVAVPFLLESFGWLPPAYAFENGNLVVLSRGVLLRPAPTLLAMAIMATSFAVLPAMVFSAFRDRLHALERRTFATAWRLRSILEEAAREAGRSDPDLIQGPSPIPPRAVPPP